MKYIVYVEVHLCHGTKDLCTPVTLQAKPLQDARVEWNQRINFDFQKRNLPKVNPVYSLSKSICMWLCVDR